MVSRWGKLAPWPGLGPTLVVGVVSGNLNHSSIRQVFPRANTVVTVFLGGRWRPGVGVVELGEVSWLRLGCFIGSRSVVLQGLG